MRAKIVKKMQDTVAENDEFIKMLISHNNDRAEEPIVPNHLCNSVVEDSDKEASGEDKMVAFHRVVDHKGPLKPGDSGCNGS